MIVRRAGHLSYHGAAVALTLVVLLFNARLYSPRGAEYGPRQAWGNTEAG